MLQLLLTMGGGKYVTKRQLKVDLYKISTDF